LSPEWFVSVVEFRHGGALLWVTAAILAYLAGGVLFLSVVVTAFGSGGFDPGAIDGTGVLVLGASAGVFLLGGYCLRRAIGIVASETPRAGWPVGDRPEASDIPQQYRSNTPGERPDDRPESPPDDDRLSTAATSNASDEEPDDPTVACPNCGAHNDPAFTYCRRCSSQL
jgi:hypothetical protein